MAFNVLEHSPCPIEFMRHATSSFSAIIQTVIDHHCRAFPFPKIFYNVTDHLEHLYILISKNIGKLAEFPGFERSSEPTSVIGRLVSEKGLAVLLVAMLRLKTSVPCLIIGSGPMRPELELWSGLPELKDRIHFYVAVPPQKFVNYTSCMDVLAALSLTSS
jgi:hypothetical protein